MARERKFLIGGILVAVVVGALMVTGMRDAMVYYYTPSELATRLASDPSWHEVGVKVGAEVVPGSVSFDARNLDLRFDVRDQSVPDATFSVHYRGPVPDTFEEGREVVLEGRMLAAGTFEATTVLTKCGSRYEAVEDDLRAIGAPGPYYDGGKNDSYGGGYGDSEPTASGS